MPTVREEVIGDLDGVAIRRFSLANSRGMRVQVLNYGGIVQTVEFPDRDGNLSNIVLGFRTFEEYRRLNPAPNPHNPEGANVYFGALIGRYANPLAGGRFILRGRVVEVPLNTAWHALHGGAVGFDQAVWDSAVISDNAGVGVRLAHSSPHGEMGFPGKLDVVAGYVLDEACRLTLTLEATTNAPTVLNLTSHIYWNLAGEGSGSCYNQLLSINADHFLPVDSQEAPTGEIRPVADTVFDFSEPVPIGERIRVPDEQLLIGHGYDHNWVLRQTDPPSVIQAARVIDPSSGRSLTIRTTQPGLQFYTGNMLQGTLAGSGGSLYRQGDGFALETQHYPDSPNHPTFPTTELDPGDIYRHITVFELTNDD
ncbi:aldose epimerase family protein [Mycobacterium aquaticum]|nr:aldose epimerase family protein [Mycobacterium aquaticum]